MDLSGVTAVNPVMGWTAFLSRVLIPEKAVVQMDARLYVGNLARSTTPEELNVLFTQAGQVIAVEVIKERKSGESKGFAFVTMGEQSQADKAVSMFNAYSLSDHTLKVSPAKSGEPRGATSAILEP